MKRTNVYVSHFVFMHASLFGGFEMQAEAMELVTKPCLDIRDMQLLRNIHPVYCCNILLFISNALPFENRAFQNAHSEINHFNNRTNIIPFMVLPNKSSD